MTTNTHVGTHRVQMRWRKTGILIHSPQECNRYMHFVKYTAIKILGILSLVTYVYIKKKKTVYKRLLSVLWETGRPGDVPSL